MRCSIAVVLSAALAACSVGDDLPEEPSIAFDFAQGPQAWTGDFADYPVGEDASFELVADYRPLPAEIGSGSALYLSGNNHSDDLFMFYKRRIDGFIPGHVYRVRLGLQIATSAPHGCAGIGGSPGESVFVKAGASTIEPMPVDQGGTWQMNIDKGDQGNGGADALLLGDVANSRDETHCDDAPVFERKDFDSGEETLSVAADPVGAIWFFAGTDSGFEGTTSIYLTRFSVQVLP